MSTHATSKTGTTYDKATVGAVIAIASSGASAALALGVDGPLGVVLAILVAMLGTAATFFGVARTENKLHTASGEVVPLSQVAAAYAADDLDAVDKTL